MFTNKHVLAVKPLNIIANKLLNAYEVTYILLKVFTVNSTHVHTLLLWMISIMDKIQIPSKTKL